MNLLTVIPLSRSKFSDTLSYFTASDVPLGALVSVPVRSKSIHAIVSDSRPVEDAKSDLKSAPFAVRKLGAVKASAFFPSSFVESAKIIAEHYATNVGAVMDTLVSDLVLENGHKISPPLPLQASFISAPPSPDETYAIQGDDADRISTWRSLIRQEFARRKSVAIYVPTIEDGKNMFKSLEKGIEGYIFLLNGSLPKKKFMETWNTIANTDHSVVVIATGSFAVLPRSDIETVVIERENGRGWISQKSPCIDLRFALETLSRKARQTVYLADCMLRAETLHRIDEHEIPEGSPFKWRSVSTARDSIVDMRDESKRGEKQNDAEDNEEEKSFKVLSEELVDLIEKNREDNTHLFVMTLRKGLATSTVCGDCGTIVICENCSAPVILHTSKDSGKNFFMCHKCGTRRSANETCKNCKGWRLTPLGIGLDRVKNEILAKVPDVDLFQVDTESTSSEKEISEVMEKFRARPGSVLIGTELALLHMYDKVDHTAVVSIDSLFALPDFRIE